MRALLLVGLSAFALFAFAAEPRIDIDPNTKIQSEPRIEGRGDVAPPEKSEPEKDKPISERKPQERAPEDASKGGTKPPQ